MPPPVDPLLLQQAVELVRRAGSLTLEWFGRADLSVDTKGDGTPVTEADRAAERFLRARGFRELRVRWHDQVARLEVPVEEMSQLLEPTTRTAVVDELRRLGFAYVALDLQGFRSGSLNERLRS